MSYALNMLYKIALPGAAARSSGAQRITFQSKETTKTWTPGEYAPDVVLLRGHSHLKSVFAKFVLHRDVNMGTNFVDQVLDGVVLDAHLEDRSPFP